ncbi:ROK family protein [Stieleria sp. JC731]|uniref:ROK family protein n=1 Tax=Pirellulaceae TaxID=2691357 RepID=UPI001E5CA467|nr:ROK family protein [Stieleria sp. JC731]MCC9599341.1 ROK family protein [Stieleria sp. JC731]
MITKPGLLVGNPISDVDPIVLGIDLGGTSVKLGLLRGDDVIARALIRTSDFDRPSDAFDEARRFASGALETAGLTFDHLQAVGLAMAGVIDEATATLMETANLQSWHGIGFYRELQSVFQKPVAVINDANAAALGEAHYGEHRADSLTFLTLGTGVGGGVIVRGRPINGEHGCGGEVGHVTIDYADDARICGCGKPGHLEAYAGAGGIVQTAQQQLANSDQASKLRGIEDLSCEVIADFAEQGDPIARAVVKQTACYLGRAIAILAHVADPDVVLLGGAVTFGGHATDTGREFLMSIRGEMARLSLNQIGSAIEIDFASLGNDAGMLGAARHASLVALR